MQLPAPIVNSQDFRVQISMMYEAHTELETFQPLIIYLVLVLCWAPAGKLTHSLPTFCFVCFRIISAMGTNQGLVFIS